MIRSCMVHALDPGSRASFRSLLLDHVDSGSHRDVSCRARARSHLSPRGGAHIVYKPALGGRRVWFKAGSVCLLLSTSATTLLSFSVWFIRLGLTEWYRTKTTTSGCKVTQGMHASNEPLRTITRTMAVVAPDKDGVPAPPSCSADQVTAASS